MALAELLLAEALGRGLGRRGSSLLELPRLALRGLFRLLLHLALVHKVAEREIRNLVRTGDTVFQLAPSHTQ